MSASPSADLALHSDRVPVAPPVAPAPRWPASPVPAAGGLRASTVLSMLLLAAMALLEWDVAWRRALGPDRRWGDVGDVSLAGVALTVGFAGLALREARRRTRRGAWTPGLDDAAIVVALIGVTRALLFVAAPAFHRAPSITVFGEALATGPLALAAIVAFGGVAARAATGRVWAATTVNAGAAAFGLAVAATAPWAVRAGAALLGVPASALTRLDVSWWTLVVPLYPLAAAVCLDVCGAWFAPGRAQRSRLYALLSGACAAVPAAAFATHWASISVGREVVERSVPGAGAPQAPAVAAYVAGALAAVLVAGPLAAWLGQLAGDAATRPVSAAD